jgi:spore coat polysaccharide biosynthesis predicted glycosyltransferase SpsG
MALYSTDKIIPKGENFFYCDWHNASVSDEEIKKASLVLIDSFRFSHGRLNELELLNSKLIFLDDYIRRDYHTGVVIDWTINSEKSAYLPRREGVLYLLGHSYCSLRKEFNCHSKNLDRKSLLISFGGSDYRRLTKKILNFFHEKYPAIHKHIVIGPSAVWNKQDETQFTNCTFHHSLDASGMQEIMSRSAVSICNGGQSLYEMASQGVVPIAISAAENQNEDIIGFEANEFAIFAGNWDDDDLMIKLDDIYGRILTPSEVKNRAQNGLNLIDGLGTKRLISAIIDYYGVLG